jgi:hypothetical protein
MGDLRSQLLKAGLVSEKKLKEVEADSRKQRKEKRGKRQAAPDPEQARRKRELEEARTRDRERQQEKHEERERRRQRKVEAEQGAREQAELGRQIIQVGGITLDPDGPCEYRFAPAQGAVRSIRVSTEQRDRLSRGDLGVAQPHANLEALVLLDRSAALRLRDACPEKLVLLHDPSDEKDEFEGLMW